MSTNTYERKTIHLAKKKLHKIPSITKESTKTSSNIRDDLKRSVLKVIFASLHLKSNCLMGGK